ncbi:hypothetical protein QBC38DRAFT_463215 [Podospora fimiseda]|uniref:Chromo domain-containing protein n=1 Tax=Podospora fimiseda TaxID=252190 RepID=A0AAN7H5J9_9PEZI|nr:hypothetical protein QBC38DRAFT_463215 [Podospora fimiseda]
MPPAVSDDEGSDHDQRSSARKPPREKKAPLYNDDDDDMDDDANLGNGAVDDEEEEEEEGEGSEDGDEEVFTVERICDHMMGEDGEPLFKIKWEGYDSASDLTWEPEENLTNAKDLLNEYLKTIGGRDKLFEATKNALKTKKRARQSNTPQTNTKRSRRENGHSSGPNTPASVEAVQWRPPAGSWENDIADLDACEDEDTGRLMVYLTWKNGKKTQHETPVIYQRCPQKMLQFYERHVRIIKRDPNAEDI